MLCFLSPLRLQGTNGNQQTPISTATVSMVHSVPELMVSSEVSHDGSCLCLRLSSYSRWSSQSEFKHVFLLWFFYKWTFEKRGESLPITPHAQLLRWVSPLFGSKPSSWAERTSRGCIGTGSWSSWWIWTRRSSTPQSSTASRCPTRYCSRQTWVLNPLHSGF